MTSTSILLLLSLSLLDCIHLFISLMQETAESLSTVEDDSNERYIDYFMVGERVRFLFTSCEESQTNE